MNNIFRKSNDLSRLFKRIQIRRGLTWGMIILGALIAFEVFNFSTTEFALKDVLGDLKFVGLRWSTILAFAFCGIDFAGIARLFTPEKGKDEPAEVWYLFAAWLLAATMNAMLTWWGVSVAIAENANLASSRVVSATTLTSVVPVFVAIMVWLIRVLIIGTFSVSGNRMFSQSEEKARFRPISMNLGDSREKSAPGGLGIRPVVSSLSTVDHSNRNSNEYKKRSPAYQNYSSISSSSENGSYLRNMQ